MHESTWTDVEVLCQSTETDQRLAGLKRIRELIAAGQRDDRMIDLSERLVSDSDNDCRWQALIVIGEFIRDAPEHVWPVVAKYGRDDDEDMRMGVATILLEHLLEHHPRWTIQKLKSELSGPGDRLRETLTYCWKLGGNPDWAQVEALFRGA